VADSGRVVVRASGHPAIRATHHKTLEITAEGTISARATCVVGVRAGFDREGLARLRGPVRYTLRAGGAEASGEALVNPGHDVRDRLVLRRSDRGDADTLAVKATLTAADLPPPLASALAVDGAEIELVLVELAEPPPLVLVDDGPPAGRLGLLAATVVPVDRVPLVPQARYGCRSGAAPAWLALPAAGLPVEPAVHLGRVGRREAKDPAVASLLGGAPVPVVVTLALEASDLLPPGRVAVAETWSDVGTGVEWLDRAAAAAAVAANPTGTTVVIPASPGDGGLVRVSAVASALTAAGLDARDADRVLKAAGVGRRERYALLAGVTGS